MWLTLLVLSCSSAPEEPVPSNRPPIDDHATSGPAAGNWRIWLDSAGGELPFDLELMEGESGWKAWVSNPPERFEVPIVEVTESQIRMDFVPYDAQIVATWSSDGRELTGTWSRPLPGGRRDSLPVRGKQGKRDRFPVLNPGAPIPERWRIDFESGDTPAVGVFKRTGDAEIHGTILTEVGDFRYLTGIWDGNLLELSTFDGSHAFLMTVEKQPDGTFEGDFWSGGTWHEGLIMRPDPDIALSDPENLTQLTETPDWGALSFPDVNGTARSLDDPKWSGGPRILQLTGTWCPNCNDQTDWMATRQDAWEQQGIEVVSLAFEHHKPTAAARVKAYAAHHGARWTYLIGGLSDKDQASEALPILNRVIAYPTLLFVDDDGVVQATYTGFTGPAAPAEHEALKGRLETLVQGLVATP